MPARFGWLSRKHAALVLVFVLFFAAFALRNHFYLPTTLTVRTEAPFGTQAELFWDTGAGFNPRERFAFTPFREKGFEDGVHTIELTRLTSQNASAQGSEVWLDDVVLDGDRHVKLEALVAANQAQLNDNHKLALLHADQPYRFKLRFKDLKLAFFEHRWAGQVRVVVDGQARLLDLYAPDTHAEAIAFQAGALVGGIDHSFPLPQTRVRALRVVFSDPGARLARAEASSSNGVAALLLAPNGVGGYEISRPDLRNVRPQPFLLAVQALVALGLSALFGLLWDYLAARRELGWRELLVQTFWAQDRVVFWGMFAGALGVFGAWLLGQWPGIMTVDSYHFTWREIKTLQFQNVTPWIYNAYVLALTQLWDSPVIVPLFQIGTMALLGAGFFYYCRRQGASWWIVAPSYAAFIFSIPVGLYNLVLWKDIPFCLSMLAWAGGITFLFFEKTYRGRTYRPGWPAIVAMAASLIFLSTVRHNGLIFLPAIPAILVLFRLWPIRTLIQFVLAVAIGFAGFSMVTQRLMGSASENVNRFFSATYRVMPLAAIYTSKYFYTPTYEQDMALINKWVPLPELKQRYSPVAQADEGGYLVGRWMALAPADQDRLNALYVPRSARNLHIFLADRTAMFMGAMGFSSNIFIITNELYNSQDRGAWRPIESYRLCLKPKVGFLFAATARMLERVTSTGGLFHLAVFNGLPPLLLLSAALMAYKYTPVSSLFAFVFLYNLPFIFLVLSTCEWRYIYFLTVASYFILPLMAAELAAARRRNGASQGPAQPRPELAGVS